MIREERREQIKDGGDLQIFEIGGEESWDALIAYRQFEWDKNNNNLNLNSLSGKFSIN